MYSLGNEDLLNRNPLAIYCSREVPLSIYEPALDLIRELLNRPMTLAGGWQSKMEKEALQLRPAGAPSNLIYFLAKGIQSFKLPKALRQDLDEGKVLVVSLWMQENRIDQPKVNKRDRLMVDRIRRFLFLNLKEGGNLEELFYKCLSQEKEVWVLDHPENRTWDNPQASLASLHHHPAVDA